MLKDFTVAMIATRYLRNSKVSAIMIAQGINC